MNGINCHIMPCAKCQKLPKPIRAMPPNGIEFSQLVCFECKIAMQGLELGEAILEWNFQQSKILGIPAVKPEYSTPF